MKLSCKVAAAIAVASIGIGTQALSRPPELSATELGALQSRNYSVPPDVAFRAVLATLQSFGYTDVNADKDSGTVSAVTEAKAKTFYNIFWGFGKKKYTQKASLLVEGYGSGSLVRLNLHLNETKARGIFGTSYSDGILIRYADPYRDFFQVLDEEMRRRGGGTALASDAAAGALSPDPADKPGTIVLGSGVKLVPADTASGYCIKAAAGYVGTGSATSPAISSARPLCT